MWRFVITTAVFVLVLPLIWVRVARPASTEKEEALFSGVTYHRIIEENPAIIVHLIEIDLSAPGIGFQVTPPNTANQFTSLTTTEFLQANGVQIAVNGSFYQEAFQSGAARPLGLVIANGTEAAASRSGWPTLCIFSNGTALISELSTCPTDTEQALAGNVRLVQAGKAIVARTQRFPGRSNAFRPQPRTAVALNQAGDTMWLVAVDGRQPNYSEGMTLDQLAQFLVELGAYEALNFDGGGSTTLVAEGWMGAQNLNSPIHNGIPTRQRPVPTHLGIIAQQLSN